MTIIDVSTSASPRTTEARSPSTNLYDFGLAPHGRTSQPKYENYLMPVAWRATVHMPDGQRLHVKTTRVGLIGVTLILPHQVTPGARLAMKLDIPALHVFAAPNPLDIEGVVSTCVLRGQEGFCAHVSVRQFANPRHRELLDQYMNDRQGLMIFLPL